MDLLLTTEKAQSRGSVDAHSWFRGQSLKLTWIVPRRDQRSVPCVNMTSAGLTDLTTKS